MAKKKKKVFQKQISYPREETGSDIVIHPDATLSPNACDNPTSVEVLQQGSTTAPIIGEDDSQEYVETFAGLADKYLFSKKAIPVTILLLISGIGSAIIFVQDNMSGVLVDFNAVLWTLKNVRFYLH